MLRKTMIGFAMAAVLTGGLTADAFARGGGGGGHGGGGGGHMGGGFGGGHIGGGLGGGHIGGRVGGVPMGSGFRGIAGQHFAGTSNHFDHEGRLRFGYGAGNYDLYDYGCGYGYPYYNPYNYNCYSPQY